MNREETKQDELVLIKNVGYFHPDLLGIKMGDTGESVAEDINVPVKQLDPITGLVPCGCGGKARLISNLVMPEKFCARCEKCRIQSAWSEDVRTDWNRAMRWKGGAE